MSKRNLIIIFAVVVISLAGFGAAYASGSTQYSWPNNCGNWNQCNCGWNNCCCNYYVPPKPSLCASFIADVTVPDGSYIAPGSSFTKTWRIRNNGTTTWNTNYKLFFASGSQMSGPSWVAMPYNVAPGQTVDLSVNLIAPTTGGTYRGNWKLQSDTGVTFGVGSTCQVPIWVEIKTQQPVYYNNCCYGNCCCVYPCNCPCTPTVPSTPVNWQNWSTTQAPAWPTWPDWN